MKQKKTNLMITLVQSKPGKGKDPIAFKAVGNLNISVGKEVSKATTGCIRSITPLWQAITDLWQDVPVEFLDRAWSVGSESFEPHGDRDGTMTITASSGSGLPSAPYRHQVESAWRDKGETVIEEKWQDAVREYETRKRLWVEEQKMLCILSEVAQRGISIPCEVSWRSEPAPGELPFQSAVDGAPATDIPERPAVSTDSDPEAAIAPLLPFHVVPDVEEATEPSTQDPPPVADIDTTGGIFDDDPQPPEAQ